MSNVTASLSGSDVELVNDKASSGVGEEGWIVGDVEDGGAF